MDGLTNFAENLLLNWMLTNGVVVRPAAWFVALHTGDPSNMADQNEVLVGTDADYVRKAVTFAEAATSMTKNTGALVWTPAVGASYTVSHISIHDAIAGGNALMKGALLVPRLIDNANPLALSTGEIIAALD